MSDTISIRVKLADAARFAAEMRVVAAEIDEAGNASERANRKSRNAGDGFAYMQKSMKLLKPALIVTALGLLVQVMNTGTAASVGFVGALLPLVGLLGALPAALLLAGQGAGVFALAFSGVKGALGGLNGELEPKKFNALSAPAQRFVLLLDSMKSSVRGLQTSVQEGLFPGLSKGLETARPALAALSGPLHMTAVDLGKIGEEGGRLVGSKSFLSDLRSQAQFNNVQLLRLGGAALFVLDGLRQLTVASRPLVSWLVLLASGWAMSADKTLIADRANGKLAAGFAIVKRTLGDVLKIGGNLGKTLFNVGNIGRKALGESLLTSLVKGSEWLKKWTESGPGIRKITLFFTEAKPAVYAFAELIGTLVKDFLKLGTGGSAGGLTIWFGKLRTETLPLLLKVTEGLTKLFGFVARTVPGGSWLLTIGYLLSKVGLASAVAKATFGATGRLLGIIFASQFETVALAGMYAVDWVKSLAGGASLAGFTTAGGIAGAAFQAAFLVAAAAIGFELGKYIGEHIQFHFDPKRIIEGKSPIWITGKEEPHEAEAKALGAKISGKGHLSRPQEDQLHKALTHKGLTHEVFAGGERTHPSRLPTPELHHKAAALRGPTIKTPVTAEVHRSAPGGRGATSTHVQTHITLNVRDKPLAEATHNFVARDEALD